MASRRIARTKSFSSYLSSINDEVSTLKSRADTTGRGIEDGTISGTSLTDEVSLVSNGISSSNYIPNYSGWRISGSGVAEFSNVFVRGDINAYSGTIGYWNISSPSVSRTFGTTSLYGTFLESSDVGDSDANKTDGTYVGLFKSYTLEPNLIVSKYRKDNIAIITTPGHAFLVGDRVYVSVTGDTSFSSIAAPVSIIAVTGDTISYINEGVDFTNLDASDNPVDNTAAGSVTLYNPDIAGLYLRDYAKREFDYGYFSNTGVSYVSAEDINVIENPSFEYRDSSDVLTSDINTSWAAGVGLNYNLETFSSPSLSRPYKNNSSYGGRLTWSGTAVSTYLSSTIDYAAGDTSQVFGLGRNLYFGATIFPRYTPPVGLPVSLVESHIISGTVSSASATATTITYNAIGGGLTFSAGQYITVTGYANDRFNVTNAKIATATSTQITVELAGDVVTTESSFTGVTSNLLKVTTTTSHGISAGNTVFLDMDVVYVDLDLDTTDIYNPHTIADGTSGYTYTVSATPAPSGSVLYLITDASYMPASGTDLSSTARVSLDGTTRTKNIFKAYEVALDLSAITISYPNVGTTTPLYDVLSSGTKALWDSGVSKYLIGTANSYMLGWVDTGIGIAALTKSNDIVLDGASIDAAYQAADPVGYAARSDIKLNIPGWLLLHDGNGVVPLSPTKINSAGYVIDDAYLSTSSNFFYGSNLDTNRWYASTDESPSYDPAQASVEGTKTWLDINLANQSASLDYFDYIGFKNNTFSKTMLVRPSVGVYDSSSTYLKFPDADYETTTFTGGQYQYLTDFDYTNISSSLKLLTGDRSVSFELVASKKGIDAITNEEYKANSAVVAGVYNQSTDSSTVYVSSDKFVWNMFPEHIEDDLYANIIFTSTLAYFDSRIRTNGSISAGAAIYTSAGNIRTYNGDIYTSVGDIYTSDGRVTATTARLTSTTSYSLSSTTHPFQVGPTSGANLRIDDNGIQTVNNGSAAALNINTFGGDINIGANGDTLNIGNATANVILRNINAFTATAVTSGQALYVSSGGYIAKLSSTRRLKQDIQSIDVSANDILSVEPRKFKYKSDVVEFGDEAKYAYGFIAEELHDAGLYGYVTYDAEGIPDGVQYALYVSALQAVVRYQASQIQSLSDRLDALEGN